MFLLEQSRQVWLNTQQYYHQMAPKIWPLINRYQPKARIRTSSVNLDSCESTARKQRANGAAMDTAAPSTVLVRVIGRSTGTAAEPELVAADATSGELSYVAWETGRLRAAPGAMRDLIGYRSFECYHDLRAGLQALVQAAV